jgi:hypothetical protein
MNTKTPKHLEHKATELERLSNALAGYFYYDYELLKGYKYWNFNHSILHSLIGDSKELLSSLKHLSFVHNLEERKNILNFINCIGKNIHGYCRGLEYHSKSPQDYLHVYRNEVQQFMLLFQKWSKTSGPAQ